MAEETNFKISQAIRFLKESFDPDAPVNVDQITSALVEHFDKRFRDDFLQSSHKPRISMKLFCNDGPRPGFFENSKPMFSSNVSQQDLIKVPSQSKVGHQSSNGTELIETVPDHSDTEGTIEMAAEQPEEIVAQPNVSPAHSIEMNEKDTTTSERSDSYEKVAESLFSQEFVPNPYNQSSDTEIVGTVNSNTDNNDSRHQKRLLSNIQQNEIEPNDQVELNHHKERSDSSASSDHNYSPISSPEIYFDETNDSFMCEPASQTNEVSPTIIGYLRIPLDHEFKMNIPRLKCILTHSGSSILSTQSAEPNETRFNQRKDIESNVDSSRVWKTFCLESSSDEDDTTVTNSLTFNEVTQDVHDVGEKLPEIEPGYHFFVSSDDSVISTMDFAMTLNQNSQCEAGSVNCDKIETKTNEELQPEVKDKEDDKIDVQPSTSAGNPRSPPLVQCFQLDESSDSEAADESEDSPKDADDDEFGGITLSLEDLEDIVDSDSSWPEIIDDENDDPVEALSKLVDLSQKHKRKMKERKKNPSKAAQARFSSGSETELDQEFYLQRSKSGKVSTVQLEKETFQAQRDEKRRLERLEINHQRLKAYVDSHLEETKGRLILEVQQNEVLVEVHPQLVQHMKPHQIKGVRFLFDNVIESVQLMKEGAGQGCILAHSMGLGKTFQTIVFLHTLFTNPLIHQSIKSVLLVVPTNIFMNWGNEIEMWLDFKQLKAFQVYDFRGSRTETQKQAVFESWQKNHGVMLITHSELTSAVFRNRNKSKAYKRALWKAYIQPGPDLVIVDEGHLIKNRKTQLNFVLSRMQTKLRVALTGTPMQNNLFEYYTMCEFVKPHLLGSRKEFEKRFANPIKKGISVDCLPSEHKLMQRRSHVLHKLLQGTVQRVDQSVFAQHLKPKYEYVIKVTMTETQEKMYRQISRRALQESSEKNHLLVYSMLESLCIHPALLCELDSASKTSEYINVADFVDREDALNLDLSNKLKVLVSLIEEAEACGDKIVIFTQRQRMLTILEKYLKQMERQRSCFSGKFRFSTWKLNEDYFRLDGHIGTEQRDASLQVFNNRSIARARLLMATTRACGIGVNMFGANRGVLFDVSWNPSVDIQAIFRLYRFGQEKPVYIYRLCTYAAFEEHIFRRQILKESMTQRVIDEKEFNRILAKEDFETMVSYEPDFSDRPALDTPVDKLLASVMVKHSDLIYEVLNHDWLLEDRSDEQLTEEERNSAWMEFETQQKNSESGLIAENYPPLFDIHCPTTSRQDASSTISNTFNTYEVNSPVNGCDPNFSSSESLVSNVPTQSTSGLNNVNDPFTHIKMKWQTQSDRNQQARSVSTQNISKSNAWTKQFTSTAQRAQPKTAKKKVNSNGNPACSNNHPSGPKPKSPLTFVSKETFEQLISTRPTSKELPKFLMTPIDPGISEKICRCIVATGFNCNFQDHVRNLHRQGLLDQFDHFTMFRAILTDLVETKTQLFSDNLNKVLNAIRQNGYTPNSIPDAVLNFIIRGKSDLNSLCNIYRVLELLDGDWNNIPDQDFDPYIRSSLLDKLSSLNNQINKYFTVD